MKTPEQHYNEIGGIQYDKFDKKSPHFDWYQMMEFAASYGKLCVDKCERDSFLPKSIAEQIKKQIDAQ